MNFTSLFDVHSGATVSTYEAPDLKFSINTVSVLPAPQPGLVIATSDYMLRFVDTRKPGLQALDSDTLLSSSMDHHQLLAWRVFEGRKCFQLHSSEPVHTFSTFVGSGTAACDSEVIAGTSGNRVGVYPIRAVQRPGGSTRLLPEHFCGVLTRLAVLSTKCLLLLASGNGSTSLMA
uniref:Uncharacterized protein n=1 Tax=Eptatretus burgeri TaxID=7764 RepID=A0A8C4WYV0_EPTBU